MQIIEPKEQRITRSYRIKPELNERFTRATEKYGNWLEIDSFSDYNISIKYTKVAGNILKVLR